jgi:hypothetical protein
MKRRLVVLAAATVTALERADVASAGIPPNDYSLDAL